LEQLISFFMNHLFVVVIVIGLIYSMFFRKSPLEKRPPNRMPDFGGGPQFPQKPRQTGTPAGTAPVERRSPPPAERREPLPEHRRQPTAAQPRPSWVPDPAPSEAPAVVRVSTPGLPPVAAISSVSPLAEASRESSEGALTRDDLTRAVVWAEILGPPRSRRPYRRS
jgi:hypothetical protein